MTRNDLSDDELQDQRFERARHDLELWGRWVRQRTSGALGYGQSTLANLQRVARSTDGYKAPINEVHCSWVDDAVNSLPQDVRIIAKLAWAHEFSNRFIARQLKVAPETVRRHVTLVVRTVAYWKVVRPDQVVRAPS